jgi:hypothetical protein
MVACALWGPVTVAALSVVIPKPWNLSAEDRKRSYSDFQTEMSEACQSLRWALGKRTGVGRSSVSCLAHAKLEEGELARSRPWAPGRPRWDRAIEIEVPPALPPEKKISESP